MQSFLSCFSCGQKTSTIVNPQPIIISKSKIQTTTQNNNNEPHNISLINSIDGDKSKTATTITFRTTDTAPSKIDDDQEYILKKIEQMKKKDLPEKKAIEQEFIRQNLAKSKTIFLVEKKWSEEYTKYLKEPDLKTMRPIDNRNLLDSKGRLRSNIKEKEDYFIINERIWRFVDNMYGGSPEIARDWLFPVYTIAYKRYEVTPCGINNPLNLCYMISMMQCLMSIPQLNYYFFKRQYVDSQDPKKRPLHGAVHKFLKQAIDDSGRQQDIKEFASFFESKFNPYEQHDAQEFFLALGNTLQEEMKIDIPTGKEFKDPESAYSFYMGSNRSIIDKCFAGQITSTVNCTKCGESSHTYLPFIDISLAITDTTLDGCLRKHFANQKLEDYYDCEKCKKKSKAHKKFTLTKSPNFLMIVMKKFTLSGKKIEDRIKYPSELDLKDMAEGHCGETKFSLVSCIVHKGSKSTKGHYYCYTKRNRKEWYFCNDESTKRIDSSDALNRDAYILVYERLK